MTKTFLIAQDKSINIDIAVNSVYDYMTGTSMESFPSLPSHYVHLQAEDYGGDSKKV